ncbi:MAG: retropepsin-like domain-containing protein [Gemmatimonadota bacterium]|nr:retropepsin-like domain-containing protein [Gemmatimonadota bacterium]
MSPRITAPVSTVLILSACARGGEARPATDEDTVQAHVETTELQVSFESPSGLIMIKVGFGPDAEMNVLMDTGVNPSVFDLKRAQDLGIQIDGRRPYATQGAGSRALLAYPARVGQLRIAGQTVDAFDALAMDLSAMGAAMGRPLDGALGYSFLAGKSLTIDPSADLLTLHAGAVGSHDSGVPMDIVDGTLFVDAVFVNGLPLRGHLDTGAEPALTVSAERASSLGLGDLLDQGQPGSVRGARGSAQVVRSRADSLRIGGHSVRDVDIAFASWVGQGDAIVGMGFFRNFVTTFDYVSGRLILQALTSDVDREP